MGMDVYGKNPSSEIGKYFRNNVWWWRPLAEYAIKTAPEICAPCKYWGSNDGDGLDAAGAVALADALQAEVNANRTEAYSRAYASVAAPGMFGRLRRTTHFPPRTSSASSLSCGIAVVLKSAEEV